MAHWNLILRSSVFQKFTMALTGLLLIVFVILHLAGNLSLYLSDGSAFNEYANMLTSMGWLYIAGEIGLIVLFGAHIATAIAITKANKSARAVAYKTYQSKGGPSRASVSSRFMPISGALLLLFILLHVWQFRFGAGILDGYTADLNGEQIRDLHRLVIETFQNPVYVIIYCFSMIVLGIHMRHGFWSAFQSFGLRSPALHNMLQKLSIILAVIISLGFLGIPVWIYFR